MFRDRVADGRRGRRLLVAVVALSLLAAAGAPVAAAGGTSVSVAPTEASVDAGQATTLQVVVDTAQGGVGAAEFRVGVDASVAEITDVEVRGSGSTKVEIADDGSSVDVEYAFRDTADTGRVTIANVTLQGHSDGLTGVRLEAAAGNDGVLVFDEGGTGYDVTDTDDATLSVGDESSDSSGSGGSSDNSGNSGSSGGSGGDESSDDPADFELSNLQAPTGATQGDAIDVSVAVDNSGEESATKAVEFRVDTDDDGSIADESAVASQDVQVDPGESSTVTFEAIGTSDLEPGTHTHGVVTEDDAETASLTVTEASPATASDSSDAANDRPNSDESEDASTTEIGSTPETGSETDDDVPGFGLVVGGVSLLAVSLLMGRRTD